MAARGAQLVLLLGTLLLVQTDLCIAKQTKICASDSETLVASLTPVDPSVSLECAPSLGQQAMAVQSKFSAYEGDACAESHPLDFGDMSLTSKAQWDSGQLTVTEFPVFLAEKLCFLCMKDNTVKCRIVVDIAKDAPTCTRGGNQAKDLNLTLALNETVYFKCPEKTDTMTPPKGAYQADCHTLVEQPDGLVKEDNSANKTYSLTLQSAPPKEETFCYECSKTADDESTVAKCSIKVKTQTTTQAATQPSSNSPTTSGTVISKASVTVASGIVFATLGRL